MLKPTRRTSLAAGNNGLAPALAMTRRRARGSRRWACVAAMDVVWLLALSASSAGAQQALASATVANGQISGITVLSGGGGYIAPPSVSLVGGGGYGAQADALVANGTVAQVGVRYPGVNYTAAPTVIITPPIDLADGLVGWWRLERNANDELGLNNGTVYGRAGYMVGEVGYCYFAGGAGFVSLGTNDVFNFDDGRGDFAILCWARYPLPNPPNEIFPVNPLVTKTVYPHDGWALWITANGYLAFSLFPAMQVASQRSASGAQVFGDNAWHHVAVTKSGSRFALYYDGQVIASTNTASFSPSDADLEIGTYNGSFGNRPSLIDEVSIYRRALRPEEIQTEYNRGSQGKYLRPMAVGSPQAVQWYWGQSSTLTAPAIGSGPLSYQWSKNGVPIAGATNATLTFAATQFLDGGLYTATVWNSYGSATSPPATVTVTTAGLSLGLVPKLTITGVTGRSYAVQYTTNLAEPVSWTGLTNLTLTVPVQVLYDFDSDATAPDQPQRYYRVVPGQP